MLLLSEPFELLLKTLFIEWRYLEKRRDLEGNLVLDYSMYTEDLIMDYSKDKKYCVRGFE